jgi:hypothetical protein
MTGYKDKRKRSSFFGRSFNEDEVKVLYDWHQGSIGLLGYGGARESG